MEGREQTLGVSSSLYYEVAENQIQESSLLTSVSPLDPSLRPVGPVFYRHTTDRNSDYWSFPEIRLKTKSGLEKLL